MIVGNVAANVLQITRGSSFTKGFTRHGQPFKGFFVGTCSPSFASVIVVQLRVTARCWNFGENYGPFGAFFLSLLKLDRIGEDSSDMVALRKSSWLRDWISNAATDGRCADWACVTPRPYLCNILTRTTTKTPCIWSTMKFRPIWSRTQHQVDFDDINSVSSGSLFPDLGEVWRSVFVLDENLF